MASTWPASTPDTSSIPTAPDVVNDGSTSMSGSMAVTMADGKLFYLDLVYLSHSAEGLIFVFLASPCSLNFILVPNVDLVNLVIKFVVHGANHGYAFKFKHAICNSFQNRCCQWCFFAIANPSCYGDINGFVGILYALDPTNLYIMLVVYLCFSAFSIP